MVPDEATKTVALQEKEKEVSLSLLHTHTHTSLSLCSWRICGDRWPCCRLSYGERSRVMLYERSSHIPYSIYYVDIGTGSKPDCYVSHMNYYS